MLDSLRKLFDKYLDSSAATGDEAHLVRLATAVLLLEVVRMDHEIADVESAAVVNGLREKFALDADDVEALMQLASEQARQATDYHEFTSLLNRHLDVQKKARIIEFMWRVAYADSSLNLYEEHLVRKIADLLYVPHAEYIAAKLRARDGANQPASTEHKSTAS